MAVNSIICNKNGQMCLKIKRLCVNWYNSLEHKKLNVLNILLMYYCYLFVFFFLQYIVYILKQLEDILCS